MTKLTRRSALALAGAALALPLTGIVPANAQVSVPAPKPGMGLVVFYRSGSGAGNTLRFTINDDTGPVAHMRRGAVVAVPVTPGDHTFFVPEANNTKGTINVKAGETVFIRSFVNTATFDGHLQFERVDEARALRDISRL